MTEEEVTAPAIQAQPTARHYDYFLVAYTNEGESTKPPQTFMIELKALHDAAAQNNLSDDFVQGSLNGMASACQVIFRNYNLTMRSKADSEASIGQFLTEEQLQAAIQAQKEALEAEKEVVSIDHADPYFVAPHDHE